MKNQEKQEEMLKRFREVERKYQAALDELNDEYYRMNESDENYNEIWEILDDNGRIAEFEETIEMDLTREYEEAIREKAPQERIDWILYKMKVELGRSFEANYKGDLYKILVKHGKIAEAKK